MIFKLRHMSVIVLIFSLSIIFGSEVQLVTSHKKSNGTLLRIVTDSILDIENIAGWEGQENWFYVTINGASITSSVIELIEINPPLLDVEVTSNKESVQIGYLLNKPLEDFEIFHSSASRVLLIQIWESLNDSLKSEVKISEGSNSNRVFSLPMKEAKGSPFYDSFVYARDKYGPQKYFVWYSDWYSTEDIANNEVIVNNYKSVKNSNNDIKEDPRPLVVIKKQNTEISGPPLPAKKESLKKDSIDISFILDEGFLMAGIKRPKSIRALQKALIFLGYDLGDGGDKKDGIDGDFGPITEDAIVEFQLERGFNTANVDGVVGEGTYRELMRALDGKKPTVVSMIEKNIDADKKITKYNQKGIKTAKELLNQPPVKTQVKRETRKLANMEEVKLLPLDLTNRKTFLKLSCNLDGADVFVDGSLIGKTPIPKKLSVSPGWHRVRIVNPKSPRTKFAMAIPDYQDIYVPQGRTQKIRINLAVAEDESD
ncbi:MAG: peptidoglycan-binding protein [Candidatus Neomarinimicrobiota bacterium]